MENMEINKLRDHLERISALKTEVSVLERMHKHIVSTEEDADLRFGPEGEDDEEFFVTIQPKHLSAALLLQMNANLHEISTILQELADHGIRVEL